jgi:DNA adenine methylase
VYITAFVRKHRLPCNPTTAFLTPVLRNINRPLTTKTKLVGRPKELYTRTLEVLDAVATGTETAEPVLTDLLRHLIRMRDERLARMVTLQAGLRAAGPDDLPLSTEAIVELIRQHLACKNTSRLAVLIVAAAYQTVGDRMGEQVKPLHSHNAADEQTGAAGDVEITLVNEELVRTVYEMKQKPVTIDDLDRAVEKSSALQHRIDNYIFVSSEPAKASVVVYSAELYESTGGTEFAILDCLGFLRHFLHLFHRSRMAFLDAYQELVLAEPDSAVSLPLKEVFLTLRLQTEAES